MPDLTSWYHDIDICFRYIIIFASTVIILFLFLCMCFAKAT